MKSISFLLLSMGLHAAALAYPVLLLDWKYRAPISVIMLEEEAGRGDGSAGVDSPPRKNAARSQWKALPEVRDEQRAANTEPRIAEPVQAVAFPTMISTPVVSVLSEDAAGEIVIAARQTEEAGGDKFSSSSGDRGNSGGRASGSSVGVGGGDGSDYVGSGSGSSSGRGSGVARSPATYAYCPKPDYPERARREGWEGTVTLRVLVDGEGKSKSLELNRSSGFAVLDQAAVDNVKSRCRFRPAREGDKTVESWIRIPVIFRLADLKDR